MDPQSEYGFQYPFGEVCCENEVQVLQEHYSEFVTIQAVIARAFSARSNLVLNRKNHALGDCFTRKKRSFAVTPLFRVDG